MSEQNKGIKFNKDTLYFILMIFLIIIILWLTWSNQRSQQKLLDEIEKSNRELIKLDVLKKQADGHYSKLVNYYNSQRDLNRQLAQSNSNLSSILKKQEERLLMINNSIISLRGAID